MKTKRYDSSNASSIKPLLDLSQAVPSYPPAQELREHLASAVNRPETARYTSIAGDNQLRHELARRLSAMYHGHVACSDCFITADCNQTFCVALQAIASPGDEVILPLPYLDDWVADKRQLFAERRRAIEDALAASRTGFRVISSGPYFVYVEHPFSRRSAADVARELAVSQHLLTVPGSVFGPGQERHLRLAFANVPAVRMTEVVDRLDATADGTMKSRPNSK